MNTNISDSSSFLYVPCHFNYSQPVNGKMLHIPCDLDYTLLNGTGAPIVTIPHELKLYFPFDDGYNISNTTDHNIYFIGNNVLRYPVKFTGAVFDYFGNPAEPIKFYAQCVNCSSSKTLLKLSKTLLLLENIASLSITFKRENIENKINVTIRLTSVMRSIKQIITTLVVELLPGIDHPGYTYSIVHEGCACYHHNVDCHDSYNEIKRGYWFGSVSNTQPQHLVIIIASSLVIQRQDKDTLNCLLQLMVNVMITELEELVGNAVQDTRYHMTPLTVSV